MRGVVFTEFLDFVDAKAGPAMVEHMLDAVDLPSGGAYTAVGRYDHAELLAMLAFLHRETSADVGKMVHGFGMHLFGRFVAGYPAFFRDITSVFDFLETIEAHIHVEVRKLYPDAELPRLATERRGPASLVLTYESSRPFADLCHGLIDGAIAHFGGAHVLRRTELAVADGRAARFELAAA